MDIQKEREAFEQALVNQKNVSINNLHVCTIFDAEENKYSPSDVCDPKEDFIVDWINSSWSIWQAAKAQAVPEGFVLVKKVHPDAIVHNQGLGLFKECQLIYGWDGKSKDFKDALNKGFYHGVKLGAKAVLETAMIEAQEPANEL